MNDYRNALNYINSLGLGEPTNSVIGFIILYMAYNQNFKDRDENCDADKFQGYFVEVASEYVANNAAQITGFFAATSEPARDRVRDMRSTTGRTVKLLSTDDKLTAVQLAKVIYQIRCNLFHGEKDLYSPDEQRLVAWAFNILRDIAVEEGGGQE